MNFNGSAYTTRTMLRCDDMSKILDKKVINGKIHYLVKLKPNTCNGSLSDFICTWEIRENISNLSIIDKYESDLQKARRLARCRIIGCASADTTCRSDLETEINSSNAEISEVDVNGNSTNVFSHLASSGMSSSNAALLNVVTSNSSSSSNGSLNTAFVESTTSTVNGAINGFGTNSNVNLTQPQCSTSSALASFNAASLTVSSTNSSSSNNGFLNNAFVESTTSGSNVAINRFEANANANSTHKSTSFGSVSVNTASSNSSSANSSSSSNGTLNTAFVEESATSGLPPFKSVGTSNCGIITIETDTNATPSGRNSTLNAFSNDTSGNSSSSNNISLSGRFIRATTRSVFQRVIPALSNIGINRREVNTSQAGAFSRDASYRSSFVNTTPTRRSTRINRVENSAQVRRNQLNNRNAYEVDTATTNSIRREPFNTLIYSSQCPICFNDCSFPCVLDCNHIFCYKCIIQWHKQSRSCPLCRAVLPSLAPRGIRWSHRASSGNPIYFRHRRPRYKLYFLILFTVYLFLQ